MGDPLNSTKDNNSRLRIGFVGAGAMGQTAHLQNFALIPDCEIVALAEGRRKTAEMVAARYAIPAVYPDHRAMLAEADIDAVVAIVPYALHPSIVPDILNAGKHLLTEKPICLRLDNARRLASLAEEKKLIYMVGNMKRALPASVEARRRIEEWKLSGAIGRMNYVRASMPPGDWVFGVQWRASAGDNAPAYPGETSESPPEWMGELGEKYNAFVNYFIHQVNMIRYLIGEDYHVVFVDKSEAVMLSESDSGVTIALEMKGHGLHKSWEEYYMVSFESGRVDLSLPAPMAQQNGGDVRFYIASEGNPRWERPVIDPVWSMLAQARHFVSCVRQSKQSCNPASEALKDLEVAEQYIRALSSSLR
ncbi:MAG: Gfo/Idh/MocA family oxidoreductase [Armatimonadetes bacterium]|nr:Gfo/Idh/MocA family oxidoreductase [Armatimonadota bacterium]